jgi:hypothetical protein
MIPDPLISASQQHAIVSYYAMLYHDAISCYAILLVEALAKFPESFLSYSTEAIGEKLHDEAPQEAKKKHLSNNCKS